MGTKDGGWATSEDKHDKLRVGYRKNLLITVMLSIVPYCLIDQAYNLQIMSILKILIFDGCFISQLLSTSAWGKISWIIYENPQNYNRIQFI